MTLSRYFRSHHILGVLLSISLPLISYGWQIEESFEGDADGGACSIFGSSQSVTSSEFASDGLQSCKFSIAEGETGFGKWGGIVDNPDLSIGDEIWMRVKVFIPDGFDYNSYGQGNVLKFLRLHTRSPSQTNEGYTNWLIMPEGSSTPFKFIFEGDALLKSFGRSSDAIRRGTWEIYEWYHFLDSKATDDGGRALVRFWKNGEFIGELTDVTTLDTPDSYMDLIYLFTYWNGGAPRTQSLFIDELKITSEAPPNRDAFGFPFIGTGNISGKPVTPEPR